ncbi:MAG: hypothetical protein FVQ80_08460 [Planctomycetes bacterium]|nr:hypothetical protein [Planctomycetota bacterium]
MKRKNNGSVGGSIITLLVLGLIVLFIARGIWVKSTNHHFDVLISAYISETDGVEEDTRGDLKEKLAESGIFLQVTNWDKESFIKDEKLYENVKKALEAKEQRIRDEHNDAISDVINL